MRVMVTGHLGYIGPSLTRALRAKGHAVVGFDTAFFRACLDARSHEIAPDREIVGDIRDISQADFEGIDAVVHLAALSNDPLGDVVADQTHNINSLGTERAALMAKRAGVKRFVFSSSCSIYGASGHISRPLDETAGFAPVSAYGKSKVYGEQALEKLQDDDFLPVFLRNATCYGVGPRNRLDLVVGNLGAHAHATRSIKVMSDGTPWRPLVHIEDVAAAMVAAVEAPRAELKYNIFNIGRSDANYQVNEIAQAVSDRIAGCAINVTGETGGDPRSYKVDFGRAANDLPGFVPQWTLERGVDELAKWLEERPAELETLFSAYYIRLKKIKDLRAAGSISDEFRWAEGRTG